MVQTVKLKNVGNTLQFYLISTINAEHFQNSILSFENSVDPDQLASDEAS